MNHSLLSADRSTHLKIVVVALIGAILVVGVGVTARIADSGVSTARIDSNGPVLKAGHSTLYTRGDSSAVR